MIWTKVTKKDPPEGTEAVVLTRNGDVHRALRHSGWDHGWCIGDGRHGGCLDGVTHYSLMTLPRNHPSRKTHPC